jgi:hypothetical protein
MILKIVLFLMAVTALVLSILALTERSEGFGSKELKFIHITKNGGTSIENVGKKHNIEWGRFHHQYSSGIGPWWHHHTPNPKIKHKYDWFMVVRNPYDRVISEIHCKWGNNQSENLSSLSKDAFNKRIRTLIDNRNRTSGDHWTEQWRYLDNDLNIHILKFENLQDEFNTLMKSYNLSIELNNKDNSNTKIFTKKDLDLKTVQLIQTVYEKDFKLFNYQSQQPGVQKSF